MSRVYRSISTLIILTGIVLCMAAQDQWQSSILYFGQDGRLVYESDREGNRIPDFSHAGYRNSEEAIPEVRTVLSISPLQGDNTAHIQQAIDSVGKWPLDMNGIRGALLLKAGNYDVYGTIHIRYSGMVLRGEGDGTDPASQTIIHGRGNDPVDRDIIVAGGGENTRWKESANGTRVFITSDFVQVGSRTFEVEDASVFEKGDNIVIYHPCTHQWLEAIDWGGTGDPKKFWHEGEFPIIFNRYITKIEGKEITVDVPVFNHLDKKLSRSFIYKYNRSGLKTNIGIEKLRVEIHPLTRKDIKNHAKNAIALIQLEDAWVRDCSVLHFWRSGIITFTASRVSIVDCESLEPYGVVTGGQFYNYHLNNASQQILIYHCHATDGRHAYVSNGHSSVSGNTVLECTQARSYTASESHAKWTTGMLFDKLVESETRQETEGGHRVMGFYNRGEWASGHGWAGAHSVLWSCDADWKTIIVQKPPTAQNYAIGCSGNVSGKVPLAPFEAPVGYIEGANRKGLHPQSLFRAQYKERTGKEFQIK